MADALRSVGAIMVGKASTHEIGIGTTGLNVAAGALPLPYPPNLPSCLNISHCHVT